LNKTKDAGESDGSYYPSAANDASTSQ